MRFNDEIQSAIWATCITVVAWLLVTNGRACTTSEEACRAKLKIECLHSGNPAWQCERLQ